MRLRLIFPFVCAKNRPQIISSNFLKPTLLFFPFLFFLFNSLFLLSVSFNFTSFFLPIPFLPFNKYPIPNFPFHSNSSLPFPFSLHFLPTLPFFYFRFLLISSASLFLASISFSSLDSGFSSSPQTSYA